MAEVVDYSSLVSERDIKALENIKAVEKSKKRKLKRVKIHGGYVMTTEPEKYEHLKRE